MDRPTALERLVQVLVALVVVGLAAYPIHARYLHLELQEHFPRNAVVAVTQRDWAPFGLHHGAAFFDLLRAIYTGWFAAGWLAGTYPTRLHFLADFLRDPFPFVVVGRAAVLAIAGLGAVLLFRATTRLFGRTAATASLLILGTTFGWVRGLHHVWIDVPSAVAALAAAVAAVHLSASGTWRAAAGAGMLGGLALATKHSMFPIAAPLAVAALLAPRATPRAVLTRLAVAGAAMAAAFFVLSPHAVIRWRETLETLSVLNRILFATPPASLTLAEAVGYGAGWGIVSLAAVGFVAAVTGELRPALVLATFPLCYLAVLARANALYLRHLTALWPFAAIFAGYGAFVLGRWLSPRRPGPLAAVFTVLAVATPAWQSVQFDRLLARVDTRELAGAWILANVPRGTPLVLPNAVRYPNPILPPSDVQLRLEYARHAAALREPEFAGLADAYPTTFLAAFARFSNWTPQPGDVVVEAEHPKVLSDYNFPPALKEQLAAAGAVPLIRFPAVSEPLPEGIVYDPLDADYVPLAGFEAVERPGPNVTIWRIPAPAP
jgi:hypothetical protein